MLSACSFRLTRACRVTPGGDIDAGETTVTPVITRAPQPPWMLSRPSWRTSRKPLRDGSIFNIEAIRQERKRR